MSDQQADLTSALRTECLVNWHIGDWKNLAKVPCESIVRHPDRALLAMLKSAALFQEGDASVARRLAEQALVWGVGQKSLIRTILSGVHNSLGRAALSAGVAQKADSHLKQAMRAAELDLDGELLYPVRLMHQKRQTLAKTYSGLPQCVEKKNVVLRSQEQRLDQQQQIKLKLDQAKKARSGKNYAAAEQLLFEIFQIDSNNIFALTEQARLKSDQRQWNAANVIYSRLLKTQSETASLILARSLVKKNDDLLDETIADLEHAAAIGLCNSQMAHQLALAYRDNQQWEKAELIVKDILMQDPAYLNSIAFSTFVSDLLRKRKKVQEAFVILSTAVENLQAKNKDIPFKSRAILEELQRMRFQEECGLEVSTHYYDAVYAQSEVYKANATSSIYLPVWERVADFINRDGIEHVLDIGCGPGQFAEYLIEKIPNINYQGVDYSQTAIEAARLRCGIGHFFIKDLTKDNSLKEFEADAIIILEVLEHIEKDLELIEKIPSGKKVIFSVPNMDSFGHVRFFKNPDAVLNRYGRYFDQLLIETVVLSGRSKIYLAAGSTSRGINNE